MNRTVAIVVGVVLVLCVCVCLVVAAVGAISGGSILALLGVTQPVADVGEKFMQSLKTADYSTAYKLCDPSLQKELGSVAGLKQMIERGQAQPVKWSFTSRNINNDTGSLEGTVTMQGGEGTVSLELVKSGTDWLVTAFDLSPN